MSEAVARDPKALGEGRSPRDLKSADENLEGTYLIRMFAEFETGVRSFWKTIRPRAKTQTEALLNQVGVQRAVPSDILNLAHAVRKYRNKLLHDRNEEVDEVTITDARRSLQIYVSRLPIEW
jgi:hypothetical protein